MSISHQQFSAILESQQKVISMIALGSSLSNCLDSICRLIESILNTPNAKSSILLLEGNKLKHGAAPSLPIEYCDAIDGVQIGPCVGSCGTAVFTEKQVIVSEIENDPLWANFRNLALDNGLKACWSTPIFSSDGTVLGSFAIYYTMPKLPEPHHLELIERFTHLSSLAIEKNQASQREQTLTQELQNSNDKFSIFTSVMPDLALILSEQGICEDIYGAGDFIACSDKKDLLGRSCKALLPRSNEYELLDLISKVLDKGSIEVFEYELPAANGEITLEGRMTPINNYLSNAPDKRHVLLMARDITERKNAEKQIEQLAFYDPLTSLPNRRLLKERLEMLIKKAKRSKSIGAILYLDLDNFKRINDSLGHSVGDELLVKVAERLKSALRSTDTIARVGGDEFVVILDNMEDSLEKISDEAAHVAKKIMEVFYYCFQLRNYEYIIGVSIGISLIQSDDTTIDEVLKRADTAMYRAKTTNGSNFTFFDPGLQSSIDNRLDLEKSILTALKSNELHAYFQPQINANNELLGAEALIRWTHPEKGIISPKEFIPIAEQCGLIGEIQSIVLRDACSLLNTLCKEGLVNERFTIAINVSPVEFKQIDLKAKLLKALDKAQANANQFKLEITENMLIDNVNATVMQMNELKRQGFAFSIDDFGSGYSSLGNLHIFPVDELKIDKCFVEQLHQGKADASVVDAIISLSDHIGFSVVAEGVENKQQADILADRHIKAMQGYYFSKPMSEQDFINWASEIRQAS